MSGDKLTSLLERADRHAQLPKLKGGLWHPLRRAWATSRQHPPLSDVAAAGGWRDLSTLVRCYTQADNHTILAVMSESKKVRDQAISRRSFGETGNEGGQQKTPHRANDTV
jgi:hypothetical protein